MKRKFYGYKIVKNKTNGEKIMKILAVGDVVGASGLEYLSSKLWSVRSSLNADLCIVNGENASEIMGLSRSDALRILDAGADVITLGNHSFGKRDIYPLLDDTEVIIRPSNFAPGTPGIGYTVVKVGGTRVLCMSLIGTVNMTPESSPFHEADRILEREKGNYDLSVVDFHAEATSEKIALGRYLDGRVSVVFGTHTHVQTADEEIFPGGTAYITDIGMTGPVNGVIGVDAKISIRKIMTHMPEHFKVADGPCKARGALFEVDEQSGKAKSVKRIIF